MVVMLAAAVGVPIRWMHKSQLRLRRHNMEEQQQEESLLMWWTLEEFNSIIIIITIMCCDLIRITKIDQDHRVHHLCKFQGHLDFRTENWMIWFGGC